MTGRKSSRGAAVVLAGCVGLAVLAPGLALADPGVPPTPRQCENLYGPGATVDASTDSGCAPPAGVVDGSPASPAETTTTAPPANGSGTASGNGSGTVAGPAAPAAVPAGQPSGGGAGARSGSTNTGPASRALSAALVQQAEPELQGVVDGLVPGDVTDLLGLPNLPIVIPQPDADGNFANVNDACLNAVGELQFPAGTEGLGVLSEQLQGFCAQLDPTNLTDLVDQLLDLLNGLIPTLPATPPATIPTTPPSTVPAYFHGYWTHQYDVNCPELTGAEADALLAGDPSDPFNLDADNDGIPCEDNPRTAQGTYVGYPVGGVSTGDGSTDDADVSPAALALSGVGIGGLALSGLTLVRRYGRES